MPRFLSSLKTRIALFTSALFMVAIWGMAFRSAEKLRHDEEQILSAQQFAAASHIADAIDAGIRVRIDSLNQIAAAIKPEWLADPRKLQAYLRDRHTIYHLFEKGLCIVGRDGVCRADQPVEGRAGMYFGDQDFFREAMASGRAAIGKAHISKIWQQPTVIVAAPIGNEKSGIVGVLTGTLMIASSNVFRAVANAKTMAAGDIFVIAPRDGVFVTASDSARILQPLPPAGVNALHDRSMSGFEGSGVTVSSRGVEELASVKRVPSTGWLVVHKLPTAEAFAPIHKMVRGIYLDAALISLLVAALTWLFVHRELATLARAAAALNNMTKGSSSFHPLPVAGSREIAQLLESFNHLQQRILGQHRIFESLARGAELGAILGLVASYVEHSHQGPLCAILLVDDSGTRLHPAAAASLPDLLVAASDGLAVAEGAGSCGTAAYRGERVVVEDIRTHPLWAGARELAAQAGVAACWAEPIKDSAGKVLGTVSMYQRQPGGPGAADIELLQQAANLASIAIEKKRSDAELQLASSVYQASDEAIVVADAANRIVAVNPAFTRVTGYTLDDVRGRDPKLLSAGRTAKAEYEAMWHALKNSGQWQGEIWNRRKDGTEYAEWLTINALRNADGTVHRYIAMFSDITERKRTAELVWRQANYDTLTGLPNRNLFYDRLHQEIRKVQRGKLLLALLYIDLDRFKEVNDALGHEAGDQLLKEAAGRIAACVRDADTVARLGGDEFAVVLPGLADISRVEQVAKDIVEHLAQPFTLGKHTVYVSASVGIALSPNDAAEAETLLNSADQAMYAAKEHGRNGFSYFTDSMQSAAQVRMQLATHLRHALAGGQFELYYQPIVDMKSGRIVKAEALLRWHHPEHGLILPAAFIPLAEEIGLIGEIGDWVFRESARVAKLWYGDGRLGAAVCCPIQISVNKSPRQFTHNRDSWLGYLQKIGLPSRLMAIEITEGLLLDDSPEVTAQLDEFRTAGVQVALDDFGTGYSAMSYLNKFHVDYVKIDQSFVQGIAADLHDRTIVEAIVAMAHKLRLKVIAEGVETEAQRDFLAAIDCDFAQGFLFAKPMPQAEFEALLFADPALTLPGTQGS